MELSTRLRLLDDAFPATWRTSARRVYRAVRRLWFRPRWGNLCRSGSFSDATWTSSDTAIDRLYVERFIAANLDAIHGRVLEVGNTTWAASGGKDQVVSVDIFDRDPNNVHASILADSFDDGALGTSQYDCVIMTQTVGVPDPAATLKTLWSALAAHGSILLSYPVLGPASAQGDEWRLAARELQWLVEKELPDAKLDASDYGSLATAIAFMAGIPAERVREPVLAWRDARFPVVTCARIDKGPALS